MRAHRCCFSTAGRTSIPDAWIPSFASVFRVIAPEQMGHGRTADDVNRPFHYHDMAEDTVALLDQLSIDSVAILGFSDGGIIGLDIALHHPERVTKLVVTGSNTRTDGYTEENIEYARTLDPSTETAPETYARLSPDGADHWPVVLGRLLPMWKTEPAFTHDEVRRIGAPSLVIVGDRDIVTLEHAVEMFRTLPDAQLCVVPNAGHGAMPTDSVLTFLS